MGETESGLWISYGALASPIRIQVVEQGYEIDAKEADFLQKRADAILTLLFGRCITDSQAQAARKKLHKQVTEAVQKATNSGGSHHG